MPTFDRWKQMNEAQKIRHALDGEDKVDMLNVYTSPDASLQQNLKGVTAGLYVQEPSGEPGTKQSMLLRGTSVPLYNKVDIFSSQPAVYINGVPVIDDRAYSYSVKNNDINPLGTATNILSGLHLNNIESIQVVKDPFELAKLGPLAANGAIWITTKDGYWGGPNFTADASFTMNFNPISTVKMTNGADERDFRASFYPKGTNVDSYLPTYLKDRTDPYFFDAPGWAKDYYAKFEPQYNVNASIGGGKGRANYYFTFGTTSNMGMADDTRYSKYNIDFYLNMMPVRGLTVSTVLQATKAERKRNRSLRDRFAEMEYLPVMTTPVPPSAEAYRIFKEDENLMKDNNDNMTVNGSLSLVYKWKRLRAGVSMKFDYQTNVRHAFWPTTLMDGFNYVTDYSGYNRRFMGEAYVGHDFVIHKQHALSVDLKASLNEDRYHYNYTRGYDGDDDQKQSTAGGGYRTMSYLDVETIHYVNSSLNIGYKWKNYIRTGVVLRYDGTSAIRGDQRWLFTPAANLEVNLKKMWWKHQAKWLSDFAIHASWARVGRFLSSDRYGAGPQFTSDNIGISGSWITGAYGQYPTITRPYQQGWVGFGVKWPYADKWEAGLKTSFLRKRIGLEVIYYQNTDKDLLVNMPVNHEFGYSGQYKQGMDIRNSGVEVTLSANPVRQRKDGWNWTLSAHFAYNKNELVKLPDGLTETESEGRYLKIGSAVDQFYLLQNKGIYTSDEEVPVKNGQKMTVQGKELKAGDPKWVDQNGDNKIDNQDKVMTGHSLPKFTGGFSTTLKYKGFDLSASLFFALGQKVMNFRAYQQYDFTTLDGTASLDAVKEIFFWQNGNIPMDYPHYNALSEVHPYRVDQDLYLEGASYVKLRNVRLGYTFTPKKCKGKKKGLHDLYVYVAGNNLLTFSNFSGDDPELVDFDGYYRGYGIAIPRSVTVGVRCSF